MERTFVTSSGHLLWIKEGFCHYRLLSYSSVLSEEKLELKNCKKKKKKKKMPIKLKSAKTTEQWERDKILVFLEENRNDLNLQIPLV